MTATRMRKRVQAVHRFDVPVERGFAFVTDLANWPTFWPGYVRLEDGARWKAPGDTARLVTRLFGRERELELTLGSIVPNRLVTYSSRQPGLPDAQHERHFEAEGDGFRYRLVVEYEARRGIAGLVDRVVLPHVVHRALAATTAALERHLAPQRHPARGP
jgi:hypothetical protein